ncbi:unnamed protein product [Caenorhabditis sp. 36 PRJEB53466]|nr:unnamed protein product [Caenorhabditis sp. 36 PRJEB53466]
MKRTQDIRKQLLGIMGRHKLLMVSCGRDVSRVQKAICSRFFRNAAKRNSHEGYRTLTDGQNVYIHPSSTCFQHQPECVVYHELVMPTKEYIREMTAIDPKWLVEFVLQTRRLDGIVKFEAESEDRSALRQEIHSHPASLPDSTLFSPGKTKRHDVRSSPHLVRRDFFSDASLSAIRAKTARHTQT